MRRGVGEPGRHPAPSAARFLNNNPKHSPRAEAQAPGPAAGAECSTGRGIPAGWRSPREEQGPGVGRGAAARAPITQPASWRQGSGGSVLPAAPARSCLLRRCWMAAEVLAATKTIVEQAIGRR